MTELTSKQRAHLRSLAHHLKPIVHIGNDGVTQAVLKTIEEAFNTRELLKVKILEGAPDNPRATADRIAESLDGVEVPQTIGRTVVLFRPDPEDPQIDLKKL